AQFGQYRLLYLTPERLQTETFQARAPLLGVALLAVDEAHCISEWGHDFRPAYRRLGEARSHLATEAGDPTPVVAVTATATPQVRRDIVEQLALRDPTVVVRGFDRPNLVWSVHHVQDPGKQALDVFRSVPGAGLLYSGTRRATEAWAARLTEAGIAAEAYHAGLDAERREATLRRWLADETRVIAATSAFGMGIDKPDVRAVVHTALPLTLEAYYQEAGRGGRDGRRAYAALVLGPDAERLPRHLIESAHVTPADVQAVYDAVGSLAQVAVGSQPEDPVRLDVARIEAVSQRAPSVVRTALDRLAEAGAWTVREGREGERSVRLMAGVGSAQAAGESVAVREFLRDLSREVGVGGAWTTIRLDRLAPRLGLSANRLGAGLDYLAARHLVDVLDAEAGVQLDWLQPRARRAPVEAAALDRTRRTAQARLADVLAYASAVGCRRQHLLAYFGEPSPPRCGRCDVCLGRHRPEALTPDDEADLRRLLDAVARGESAAGPTAPRRERTLADWLVGEGYLRLDDPLAVRFSLTPKGQRHLAGRRVSA
ncbi:MAG: RecQ family ATP-dependent DNA helicase, partial [Bacteroidota bacterium]